MLITLVHDLRRALRALIAGRSFSLASIVTLALGVGASTAIFSFISAVFLRPLPFPDADRLIYVQETARRDTEEPRPVSYPDFLDWREQGSHLAEMVALDDASVTLTGEGGVERVRSEAVSPGYFSVLGVTLAMGRGFRAEEERAPLGEPVAVIGHALWQRRLGGEKSVLGRTLQMDGRTFTVVGVAPSRFRGLSDSADVWLPFTSRPSSSDYLSLRGARFHEVLGRLRDGVSRQEAGAGLAAIAARLEREYPDTNDTRGVRLMSLADAFFRSLHRPLLVLLGAVGLVLLIACANVANLTLARLMARHREVAVRAALGASRWLIVRHLLTESMLVAGLGGAAGVLTAYWGLETLARLPVGLPAIADVHIDGFVLAFALSLVGATGLLSGLAPAWHSSRTDPASALRSKTAGAASGPAAARLRAVLVVCETAVAGILLVGAGLLLRSFWGLVQEETGFRSQGVLTARFQLPEEGFPSDRVRTTVLDLEERISALPGVGAVALASDLPLGGDSSANWMTLEGRPPDDPSSEPRVYQHRVSGGFFEALGVPLIRGRGFGPGDGPEAPGVIVVSESAARRFWPGQDPVGKRMQRGQHQADQPWLTVVGVAGDVRYRGLRGSPDDDPDVYFPLAQRTRRYLSLAVQASVDPATLAPAIRAILEELAPEVPLFRVSTLDETLAGATAPEGATAALLGGFALLALVLASMGIYGVISYSVRQRTQEIGIRMALGARRLQILRMVLRQGMGLTVVGVSIGLACALGLTRFLETLLFGVAPTDPGTYLAIAALLSGFAALACYFPARRATRVDPINALHDE